LPTCRRPRWWLSSFQRVLRRYSIKSCKDRVFRCWQLNSTTFANIHITAFLFFSGHSLSCGRRSQSSRMRDGVVRSMIARRVFIYCQIRIPSPQSISLCSKVSIFVHPWHISDGTIFRTRNPSKRAAADPRLRPRSHWDQPSNHVPYHYC